MPRPYTIEEENHALGTRRERSASKYASLEEARVSFRKGKP
jgi:hypothetical protein